MTRPTKAAIRSAEAMNSRLLLIERTDGRCEWCNRPGHHEHHIANGPVRSLALGKLFAITWLCSRCHEELHHLPKNAAVCIALALIRYHRPDHYSLESYYQLTRRRWPDEADVEHWWERMLQGRTRD